MQNNMKEYRQLMSYCARVHKKNSIVRHVIEIIASVRLKRVNVISTSKIKLICKSRGIEVSSSYVRQIFFRLVEKGVLIFNEATTTGKRLILFCSKGVTRLVRKKALDSKKPIKNRFNSYEDQKKALWGGFFDHDKSINEYIEINPITNERIKRIISTENREDMKIRTRHFQTENFKTSYKLLERIM